MAHADRYEPPAGLSVQAYLAELDEARAVFARLPHVAPIAARLGRAPARRAAALAPPCAMCSGAGATHTS